MNASRTKLLVLAALLVGSLPVNAAVGPVPSSVRSEFKLSPFYEKYVSAGGLPSPAFRGMKAPSTVELDPLGRPFRLTEVGDGGVERVTVTGYGPTGTAERIVDGIRKYFAGAQ